MENVKSINLEKTKEKTSKIDRDNTIKMGFISVIGSFLTLIFNAIQTAIL